MNKFTGISFVYSGGLGLIVGVIAALFMGMVELGNQLLWQIIPRALGDPFIYPLLICSLGGIVIGFFIEHVGKYPKMLPETLVESQETGRLEYKNGQLLFNILGAMLVLLFGASVSPEASLMIIVGGVITFFCDHFKVSLPQRKDLLEFASGTVLGVIFTAPLFGVGSALEKDDLQNLTESKLKRYVLFIFATFTGFIGYLMTYSLFPNQEQVFAIQRMSTNLSWQGILLVIPTIALGAFFGKFFLWMQKQAENFNQRIKRPMPLTITAGVLLGILGLVSPYFLFSGEHSLLSFTRQAETMSVFIILLIAFGKVAITMICLACNWRGGIIFPMIFSSIAAALALVQVFPFSNGLLVAIFTASSCAVILKRPFATACLFLFLFPVQLFLWTWLAGYLGNLLIKKLPLGTSGFNLPILNKNTDDKQDTKETKEPMKSSSSDFSRSRRSRRK
ncbi:chloride channel protein [Candidatus Enterococcus ferrettii]|uniref:Chloride channel protein n=1 Tax=Candidatus Enterococcus ferrettii TaxID=2815324 RepID=A0ABV0EV91_9ENTE|nr:chloride channel protein [Enterococcus sp. 665A]MBO1340547.1 chloride channel protein [Enterococcus sp. 665A]